MLNDKKRGQKYLAHGNPSQINNYERIWLNEVPFCKKKKIWILYIYIYFFVHVFVIYDGNTNDINSWWYNPIRCAQIWLWPILEKLPYLLSVQLGATETATALRAMMQDDFDFGLVLYGSVRFFAGLKEDAVHSTLPVGNASLIETTQLKSRQQFSIIKRIISKYTSLAFMSYLKSFVRLHLLT